MLLEIHSALRSLLYGRGQINPLEVDIQFELPTKDWISSLTRPTISLFLFDLQENTELRQTGMQVSRGNGKAERRMAPRRIDLRYMVSVLTTEIEDEHQLLWRVLVTFMRYQQLPPEVLPDALRSLEPPLTIRIGERDEGGRLLDVWNALDVPPHPALCYIVTAPLDLDVAMQAPLVLTRRARYMHTASSKTAIVGAEQQALHLQRQQQVESGIHIGGIVRDRNGQPVAGVTVKLENSAADGSMTDQSGRFVLRRVPDGLISLSVLQEGKVQKRVDVSVPADSYDIVLDG